MKANKHKKFDSSFPEEFDWRLLTSEKLEAAAAQIVDLIRRDFADDRSLVPGLRTALRCIADVADTF